MKDTIGSLVVEIIPIEERSISCRKTRLGGGDYPLITSALPLLGKPQIAQGESRYKFVRCVFMSDFYNNVATLPILRVVKKTGFETYEYSVWISF